MPPVTQQLPVNYIRANVVADSWNPTERTIDVVWTTGYRGKRFGWDGPYFEELEVSPQAVRMERLDSGGAPVLNSHNSWDLEGVIGVVVRAWLKPEASEGYATLRMSERPEIAGIVTDIIGGIIRNISVGYIVHAYTRMETSEPGDIPVFTATDWEPCEISFTPVGFDPGAQSRSAERTMYPVRIEPHRAAGAHQEEGPMPHRNMQPNGQINRAGEGTTPPPAAPATDAGTDATATPPAADPGPAPSEAERATLAERRRIATINQTARMAGLPDAFAADLVARGVTVEQAHEAITARWAAEDTARTNNVRVTRDESVTRRAAIENAIMHRGAPRDVELTEAGREFRGMSLLDIARECVEHAGGRTRGMSRMEVASAAFNMTREGGMQSTSDFPILLGSVVNRTLRQAYEAAPQTFWPLVREVSAADFRDLHRVQMGSNTKLLKVAEGGEFKRSTFSEDQEVYKLATFGRVISISRQFIVNDDLNGLLRVPMMFGRAAADLESDTFWAMITGNVHMYSDDTAIFHADHKNLDAVNAAITVASLGKGRAGMRKQKDPDGKLLNVRPEHLIVPAALETTAQQFLTVLIPNDSAKVNPFASAMNLITEPRLDEASTTAWYLGASPGQIDMFEVAYLEGQRGVYTETRMGFEVDGMEMKARLDLGMAPIDWRGLWKNAGA